MIPTWLVPHGRQGCKPDSVPVPWSHLLVARHLLVLLPEQLLFLGLDLGIDLGAPRRLVPVHLGLCGPCQSLFGPAVGAGTIGVCALPAGWGPSCPGLSPGRRGCSIGSVPFSRLVSREIDDDCHR